MDDQAMPSGGARQPLDGPARSRAFWTTVNAREAIPGVTTPLNWWWMHGTTEPSFRRTFRRLGVLRRDELAVPQDPDERFFDVFRGRAAANVDMFRRMSDRVPGASGDAFERDILGSVRAGTQSARSVRRYGIIGARFPAVALVIRRELAEERRLIEPWWRDRLRRVEDIGGPGELAALFAEAYRRFARAMTTHITCTMVTQGVFDQLAALAARASVPGTEQELVTGYGTLEEMDALRQLWTLSRSPAAGPLSGLLERYGFISNGDITSRSWREDLDGLEKTIAEYAQLGEDRAPAAVHARQRDRRLRAERVVLAGLAPHRRPAARLVFSLASSFLPTRETGRATILMALDAGRAAARRAGRHLAGAGVLEQPDDVFFLTGDELGAALLGCPPADPRGLVEARRERRQAYLGEQYPDSWTGLPEPCLDLVADPAVLTVNGIGVGVGTATGTARIVDDPMSADEFADGDILVCRTTDPSWAVLLLRAGGVVIDIGGPLSHGAIVARELGLPCVINTLHGTRMIPDGATVTVDAAAGVVTRRA